MLADNQPLSTCQPNLHLSSYSHTLHTEAPQPPYSGKSFLVVLSNYYPSLIANPAMAILGPLQTSKPE